MSGGGHARLILTLDAESLISPTGDPDAVALAAGVSDGLEQTIATAGETTGRGAGSGPGPGAGPGGTLCWVGPVTASTARRVGCDADVSYVAVNDQGGARGPGRGESDSSAGAQKSGDARPRRRPLRRAVL